MTNGEKNLYTYCGFFAYNDYNDLNNTQTTSFELLLV